MRFLAQIFGWPFWGLARGFLAAGDFWRGWGFLVALWIFGTPRGFWRLRVFGGVQRIFPTIGKFEEGGVKSERGGVKSRHTT